MMKKTILMIKFDSLACLARTTAKMLKLMIPHVSHMVLLFVWPAQWPMISPKIALLDAAAFSMDFLKICSPQHDKIVQHGFCRKK